MSVLFTLLVIAALAAYGLAVYRRLAAQRNQVKLAWQKLEADQSNEAIKTVYNKHVDLYNAALAAFPANVVALAGGFKPARRFQTETETQTETSN
ncbi:MAG TPA: LemA family protein [Vicinamibacterales bacterium]